jgi:hypothetical protein
LCNSSKARTSMGRKRREGEKTQPPASCLAFLDLATSRRRGVQLVKPKKHRGHPTKGNYMMLQPFLLPLRRRLYSCRKRSCLWVEEQSQ